MGIVKTINNCWEKPRWLGAGLLFTSFILFLVTSLAPIERTLGEGARLVYFHGAWVWAGKFAFAAAAAVGLVGLVWKKRSWLLSSRVLGWAGLVFWLTYLPLSLYVQQVNWGGIFWDEPRWRIPLMFGVAGLLLQGGLVLLENLRFTSAANLVFGAALWWFLGSIQNVLHPDSPILQSNSVRIQIFFFLLVVFSVLFGGVLARLFYLMGEPRGK